MIVPSAPVLVTKITPPPCRAGALLRPHLLALLDRGLERPVTLIAAGAGFGKTTLVNSWLTQIQSVSDGGTLGVPHVPVRCAWLALDAGDNDPARFWRYVLASIDRVLPGIGGEATTLAYSSQPSSAEVVIATLLNSMQQVAQPLVLVLDDYHLIEQHDIHRNLAYAIDHLPADVHIVIVSRADPPLPLSRWRARDQLVEVRAEQLRFSGAETHAFLVKAMDLALSPEQTALLEARTEGWAAGLHLAALSLRGQRDPQAFISQFAASHRTALDYLMDEVFAHQPAHIQRFLLQTAILDRMTPALCDALLGVAQPLGAPFSHLVLDDLDQQNLFLIPLDADRTWYRYHHLFSAALRQRVQRLAPEQLPELHRRAARWLANNDFSVEAMTHALAADEHDLAAELIESVGVTTWLRGEVATLQRWIGALPEAVRRRYPSLLLWRAWIALLLPDRPALQHAVAQVEPVLASDEPPDSPRWGELLALKGWLARFDGATPESYTLTMCALEILDRHGSYWRTLVRSNAAQVAWAMGDMVAAKARAIEAMTLSEHTNNRSLAIPARAIYAWVLLDEGQLRQAAAHCVETLTTMAARGLAMLPMNAYCHVVLGEIALLRGNLDGAQHHADDALALLPPGVLKDALLRALALLVGVAQAGDDRPGGAALLERIERELRPTGMETLTTTMRAQRAMAALLDGHIGEAAMLLDAVDLTVPLEMRFAGEVRMALALLRIDQHRPAEALALLEPGLQVASLLGMPVTQLVAPIRAFALDALAQTDAADQILIDALSRAAPEGLVHPFRVLGQRLVPLLRRLQHTLAPTHSAYTLVTTLLATTKGTTGRAGQTATLTPAPHQLRRGAVAQPLIEPLSARELEVLALLAHGATNQQIADQLIISERTAKKHVTNILGKLDATNRTQAVARAREVGLLP